MIYIYYNKRLWDLCDIAGHDEVVSVFEDPMLQLHTTRSWDFLDSLSGESSSFPIYNSFHGSSDIIIGVVDTGENTMLKTFCPNKYTVSNYV